MNIHLKVQTVKSYYSYQDCWNYALAFQKNIRTWEIRNNVIALCRTVPEKFWLDFANKFLSFADYHQICRNLNRYLTENYPVPYLTNEVSFYGLSFYVEKGVFIPQRDTEVLVEKTLELAAKIWTKKERLKVLDIGTGCGNIVISLAKNQPNWNFRAVDINKKSLKTAKINASIQQVKNVKFFPSNLFDKIAANEKFDIIVANPPYLSNAEYENISSAAKSQPKEALVAENDGYFFYQKIFQKARSLLRKKFLLVVEVGHRQREKVIKLVIEYFWQIKVSIFPDWEGRPRVIGIYRF